MSLTDREAVRVLIFDRDTGAEAGLGNPENKGVTGSANFSDDEVDWFLAAAGGDSGSSGKIFRAAAIGCRALAAKNVRRSVTASVGGTFTHDSRQISVNYRQLAKDYEDTASSEPVFLLAAHSATVFSHADRLHEWAVDRYLV